MQKSEGGAAKIDNSDDWRGIPVVDRQNGHDSAAEDRRALAGNQHDPFAAGSRSVPAALFSNPRTSQATRQRLLNRRNTED